MAEMVRGAIGRLLQPATDLGVVLQLIVLLATAGWLLFRLRTRPEWRLVVVGATLVFLGLMGVRAAH